MKAIRVGQIGATIKAQILDAKGNPLDVSGADTVVFNMLKPDGTLVTKTATNIHDGTDGHVKWTSTAASDLDVDGEWKYQARATKAGDYDHYTDEARFPVVPILAAET